MKSSTYHVFFSKLSNPLRIKIISSLDEKPKSVSELSEKLSIEQSKLSHALKELKGCNIVNVEKKGKQRIYSLSKTIIPILRLIECHSKNCDKCRGCGR
jgi:DNA-binding transcriptional ArsR family regulator